MQDLCIKTLAGVEYRLKPVPMSGLPSREPSWWLRFQGKHVPGTLLAEETQAEVRRFMRKHRTEALTDGVAAYTLAGGMLAHCNVLTASTQDTQEYG